MVLADPRGLSAAAETRAPRTPANGVRTRLRARWADLRVAIRFGVLPYRLVFFLAAASTTGISTVADTTRPSFQSSNDRVSFAVPRPASSGTRTGPWKMFPQQRSLRTYFRFIGLTPGSLAGNRTSTTG